MKTKDISKQYGIDDSAFTKWLESSGHATKSGRGGLEIVGFQDVAAVVEAFKVAQAEERDNADRQQADQARAVQEKQQALASMLITAGFNFDGYTVTKYSGYISGDDAIAMDRPTQGFWGGVTGNVGSGLLDSLKHIRRNALAELKESAYALGCNAIIGVDFDYLTLDPVTVTNRGGTLYLPFLFAVTANGNAVVIEKNKATGL